MKPSFFLGFFIIGFSLPIAALAFDYFVLAKTWTPEFCYSNPSKCQLSSLIKQEFSIHGLWPQNKDGSYPSFCQPCEKFVKTKLKPFKKRIIQYWDDTFNSIDWSFLQHEWEKHGCCSNMSLLNYFDKTLELAQKWDYLLVWNSIGIKPTPISANITYHKDILESSAKDFCGNKCDFVLTCDKNQYISGFFMTLDKNLSVYNNSGIEGNCANTVYFNT